MKRDKASCEDTSKADAYRLTDKSLTETLRRVIKSVSPPTSMQGTAATVIKPGIRLRYQQFNLPAEHKKKNCFDATREDRTNEDSSAEKS